MYTVGIWNITFSWKALVAGVLIGICILLVEAVRIPLRRFAPHSLLFQKILFTWVLRLIGLLSGLSAAFWFFRTFGWS